ncbi:MAG TPA: ABC transporter ATP-binding protein [Acidimicrobiales bacterium]|nr:ABC transporter ATP-binding protein [Acidimicrobiales bacterium]
MTTGVLELRDVTRRFGAFTAVDGVNLTVAANSIHSVIGPNGAGKSTLFRLITGVHRPTHGAVHFDGRDITGLRPHRVARHGLSQSFQITSLFPRMSVLENVQAAIVSRSRRSADVLTWFHWSTRGEALELLERVGLAASADLPSEVLSHGDQRALEMAVALATRPRMLLLDEPTAGMSPYETARMVQLVSRLRAEEGLTVLFSEHDMDVVFGISDRVTVLAQGRVIADGPAETVRDDAEVMAVYLGSDE